MVVFWLIWLGWTQFTGLSTVNLILSVGAAGLTVAVAIEQVTVRRRLARP